MAYKKKLSPPLEKPMRPEPEYVDEAFPFDGESQDELEVQEDLWEKPLLAHQAILDEEEEAELEESEVHASSKPDPSSPEPAPKVESPSQPPRNPLKSPAMRSIRLNKNRFQPTLQPRPATDKKELPSRLPPMPRNGHRTGTWPVGGETPRNGHLPARPATPPPPPKRETAPLPEKPTQPVQRHTPPAENKHISETPVRPNGVIPPRANPSRPILPPPVLRNELDEVRPAPPPVPHTIIPPNPQTSLLPSTFRPLTAESEKEIETKAQPQAQHTGWDQVAPARPRFVLDELITQLPLPENALILGVCEDGLPLVLELADPSPGAVLLLGENPQPIQHHLQAILASVFLLSNPKNVQVDVITPAPERFARQKSHDHIRQVYLPEQEEVYELLGCLFELIEERQRKENRLSNKILGSFMPKAKDPYRILAIDQLDVLLEQLAPESLAYLRWLLRRGPAANVWVFATLTASGAASLDGKTLKSFGLQVSGRLRNGRHAPKFVDIPMDELSHLETDDQACMKLDDQVICFQIPDYAGSISQGA